MAVRFARALEVTADDLLQPKKTGMQQALKPSRKSAPASRYDADRSEKRELIAARGRNKNDLIASRLR